MTKIQLLLLLAVEGISCHEGIEFSMGGIIERSDYEEEIEEHYPRIEMRKDYTGYYKRLSKIHHDVIALLNKLADEEEKRHESLLDSKFVVRGDC